MKTVTISAPTQPFGLRLLPSPRDPLLLSEQLPRDQAHARPAGFVDLPNDLEHLLH